MLYAKNRKAANAPKPASMRKPSRGIGALQYLHFLLRRIKLKIGIKSYHFKVVLQLGHIDLPLTILKSLSYLKIKAELKLPMLAPKRKTMKPKPALKTNTKLSPF